MKTATPSDWKNEPMPAKQVVIPLDLLFSSEEMSVIQCGLIPRQMEDKWFIYWRDGELFFHRSWTGYCIYIARFETNALGNKMVAVRVNRDPEQYQEKNDEKDRSNLTLVINTVLLHRPLESPVCQPSENKNQLLISWSLVGNAALGQHPKNK